MCNFSVQRSFTEHCRFDVIPMDVTGQEASDRWIMIVKQATPICDWNATLLLRQKSSQDKHCEDTPVHNNVFLPYSRLSCITRSQIHCIAKHGHTRQPNYWLRSERTTTSGKSTDRCKFNAIETPRMTTEILRVVVVWFPAFSLSSMQISAEYWFRML